MQHSSSGIHSTSESLIFTSWYYRLHQKHLTTHQQQIALNWQRDNRESRQQESRKHTKAKHSCQIASKVRADRDFESLGRHTWLLWWPLQVAYLPCNCHPVPHWQLSHTPSQNTDDMALLALSPAHNICTITLIPREFFSIAGSLVAKNQRI